MSSQKSTLAADDQAALWAAKLDGSSLSSPERTQLEAWLAESPNHRALLSQYCQFSTDLEERLPVLVAAGRIAMPDHAAPSRPRFRRTGLWFATTLAAAATIALGIWALRPVAQVETVATSVAQRRTLRLADGSQVELNARTSLLVDFTGTERHVRMADGEAFFTVAKNKARPFIVETPGGAVRVTGTVFDVHADTPTNLTVTVVEGSVQVNPNDSAPVSLHANDQLKVESGHAAVQSLATAELDDALAWRRGQVVFDGTRLDQALAQFARYHGRTITAAPAVANLRVSGRYNLDNVDAFLTDIESVLPVQESRESSGAIVVTPRTGS